MKLVFTYIIIIFIFSSCKENEKQKQVDDYFEIESGILEDESEKKVWLKNFTEEEVSKYAIATIMNQPPEIINVVKENDFYIVSYIRKSDSQKFTYKVKINNNEIMWGNLDGRWRDHEFDEKLSFTEKNDVLKIHQIFSDNSSDTQEYKK